MIIEDKENPKIHEKLELVYELSTTARWKIKYSEMSSISMP